MKRIKLTEENGSPEKDTGATLNLFENQILTNPLLTDAIFPQISDSDLLTCSLVSKACNLTCRALLVERSPSYLRISNDTPIKYLQEFDELISNVLPGHQHPFNGIQIKFGYETNHWPFFSQPFLDVLCRVMSNFVVKFQSFDMENIQVKGADFQEIFKTLTLPHLKTLEFLEILNFDGIGSVKSLAKGLGVGSLPKLKHLDLGNSQPRLKSSTFKRILRACPNLKTFPGFVVPLQLATLRDTNKRHCATNVIFNFLNLIPKEEKVLAELGGLITSLKVKEYSVWGHSWSDAKSLVLAKLFPLFSKHCQHHLKTLDIWMEALAVILGAQFPPLRNLDTLICRGSQLWFTLLFEAPYLPAFFPNLKSVTLYWTNQDSQNLRTLVGQGPNPLLLDKTPAGMDSVSELKVIDFSSLLKFQTFDLLMKRMDLDRVFPCVTHLEIRIFITKLKDFLEWICECWGDSLETLILEQTICSRPYYEKSGGSDRDSTVEDWHGVREGNRQPLPLGVKYADKLSQLRRLELGYHHPRKTKKERFYEQETNTLECEFEPRVGQHKVQVLVSGCRAKTRMSKIKSGLSIYETILELHPCPQDLGLSLMEQIIATEPICKKLCQFLPTSDLYKCLRVSQKMNNISREILHQDRVCTLTIDPLTTRDKSTSSKIVWLRKEAPKLFNSLRLRAPFQDVQETNYDLHAAFPQFLETVEFAHKEDFKYLEVSGLLLQPFDTEYSNNKCPDSEEYQQETELNAVIKNIVKAFLGKLSLDQVQYLYTGLHSFDNLFRDEEGSLLVPNLKCVKFIRTPFIVDDWKVWGSLLRDLKFLEGQLESSFSYELLGHIASLGKAHCVARVHLRGPEPIRGEDPEESSSESRFRAGQLQTPSDLNFIRQFAQNRTQLRFLFVAHDTFSSAQAKTIHREALRLLCTSSYDSLHTLALDILALNLLSLVYTKPLVNLNFLRIMYSHGDFDSQQLLSKIPFCEMFPTLTRVAFTQNASKVNYFLEEGERYRPQDEPHNPQPCTTVHSMEFCGLWGESEVNKNLGLSSSIILSLARLFPNVVVLGLKAQPYPSTAEASQDFSSIASAIWEGWPCLENLRIHTHLLEAMALETSILGISQEEWSTWKEAKADSTCLPFNFYNTMQYAPTAYSIRNCKGFKNLLIHPEVRTCVLARVPYSEDWNSILLSPIPVNENEDIGEQLYEHFCNIRQQEWVCLLE